MLTLKLQYFGHLMWRTEAFKLWCCRRLLRVPWTARSSNQSILQKVKTKYSLEDLMLKLKLQYYDHLMRRANSLEKTLMLGKIEGRRRWDDGGWDGWTASPTQWTLVWASSGSWWWKGKTAVLQPMESWRVRHDWATKRMNNNTYFQVHLGLFIGKIVSEI